MPSYPIGIAYGKVIIDATNLARAQAAFMAFGRSMTAVGLVGVAAVAGIIKVTADFERELDFFKAVSGATEAQMEKVRAKALELGTTGIFGPRELARAFAELGKAGVRVHDILNGVAEATVQLATAGDIPLAASAEYLVNVMQTFNLEAREAAHVADLFAGAANASTVDVEDLAFSFKYAGAVAASVGVPVDDLTTAIGELGLAGIRGSTAGTSLRRILLNLTPVSGEAATAMRELGIITEDGNNRFYDAQGNAKGLAEVFGILHESTKNLSAEQRTQALNTIFGNRAVASAAFLARRGAEGFREFKREILGISAAEVAAERIDNLSGSIQILKSTLESAFIQAGTGAQEGLQDFVESVTSLVRAFTRLSPKTQENIVKFIAFASALFLVIGVTSLAIGQLIKMYIGLKGVIKAIKILWPLLVTLGQAIVGVVVGAVGATAAIIIAIVLAVIGIIVLLYFKVDAVRNFIDGVWQWMQTAWDAVLNFFGASVSRVAAFANDVIMVWQAVMNFFQDMPGRIVGFFDAVWDGIYDFVTSLPGLVIGAMSRLFAAIVGVVSRIPGTILRFLQTALTAIVDFLAQLPNRAAYALGYLLGTILRITFQITAALIGLFIQVVAAIVNFFQDLPGRVVGILNALWDQIYSWGARLVAGMRDIAFRAVLGVARWFQQLPGRVIGFLTTLWQRSVAIFNNLRTSVVNIVQNFTQRVIDFIQRLPGRIISFLSSLPGRVGRVFSSAASSAVGFMRDMASRIIGFMTGLPGRMIAALGDLAGQLGGLFADAASAAWNGFRDAIFGSPKTKIEYALLNIVETTKWVNQQMQREMAKMNRLAFNKYGGAMTAQLYAPAITPSQSLVRTPLSALGNGMNMQGGDTFNLTTHTDADAQQIIAEYSWMKQVVVTRRG